MVQIYDDPHFNDKVIRKTCEYFWNSKEYSVGDMIDAVCVWENPSTIAKVKLALWRAINNGGKVRLDGYDYTARVFDLKFAYELLVKNEEEMLEDLKEKHNDCSRTM